MIEISHLNKVYKQQGKAMQALRDISFTVNKGEIFGIIGKSGAGKSTLLRCINLLEKPSSGSVIFAGANITTVNANKIRQVRQKMGMIFQHFNLLNSRNVFDNVALPLELLHFDKKIIQEKVNRLLSIVGLENKKMHFPAQLSGGEKQRAAIARALVTDPEVLLCDEATSALDPETTQAILSLLKEIHHEFNITIVLITHEMDVIKKICHQVVVLDHGQLVEKNSVVNLFTQPKTETVKRLINASLHVELPDSIKLRTEGNYPVVKLSFIGEQSKKPIMSELMKVYQVAANILLADIGIVDEVNIGVTVCQLVGEKKSIEDALIYLQQQVQVEILGYAD